MRAAMSKRWLDALHGLTVFVDKIILFARLFHPRLALL